MVDGRRAPSSKRGALLGFLDEPYSPLRSRRECSCGQLVAHGRSTSGHDVVLDAGADGQPRVFAHGSFVEVATIADTKGRRALLVQPDAVHGQYRLHSCPAVETARP